MDLTVEITQPPSLLLALVSRRP